MAINREKLAMGLATAMPTAALAVFFLFGPTPTVYGFSCDCYWGGSCYSQGACVQSVCGSGSGQQCLGGDFWNACSVC